MTVTHAFILNFEIVQCGLHLSMELSFLSLTQKIFKMFDSAPSLIGDFKVNSGNKRQVGKRRCGKIEKVLFLGKCN
jgi:hypothetical protein